MGKGSKWRKGINFKKYQESDYWKNLEERKLKDKNNISEKLINLVEK
jgi:hypothetical protein